MSNPVGIISTIGIAVFATVSVIAISAAVTTVVLTAGNGRPSPADGFIEVVETLNTGDYELVERDYLVRCPPGIFTSVPLSEREARPLPTVLDVFTDGDDRALVHFDVDGKQQGVQLLEWQDGRWRLACNW